MCKIWNRSVFLEDRDLLVQLDGVNVGDVDQPMPQIPCAPAGRTPTRIHRILGIPGILRLGRVRGCILGCLC